MPEGFNLLAPGRLWPFVTSGIFSLPGKARMAMDLVIPRRGANEEGDESLAEFVRRRLGREALERMAQPMAGGIYTADPETLSLRATLPRFQDIERRHRSLILGLRNRVGGRVDAGSDGMKSGRAETVRTSAATGARYSLFRSFDDGMQVLTDQLAFRILELNSQIFGRTKSSPINLNTRVESHRSATPYDCGNQFDEVDRSHKQRRNVCRRCSLFGPAFISECQIPSQDRRRVSF